MHFLRIHTHVFDLFFILCSSLWLILRQDKPCYTMVSSKATHLISNIFLPYNHNYQHFFQQEHQGTARTKPSLSAIFHFTSLKSLLSIHQGKIDIQSECSKFSPSNTGQGSLHNSQEFNTCWLSYIYVTSIWRVSIEVENQANSNPDHQNSNLTHHLCFLHPDITATPLYTQPPHLRAF